MRDTDLLETHQRVNVLWRPALGSAPSVPRSAFSGYVIPTRHSISRIASGSQYMAETSDGFLRKGWLQGIGFAENVPPSTTPNRQHYHQFSDTDALCLSEIMAHNMNIGKMITHILGYYDTCNDIGPNWIAHCNLVHHPTSNPNGWINLDDVETSTWSLANQDGSMSVFRYAVRETDNLWSRLNEMARNEFFVIYFDKTDTLHYHKHPMYLSGALPTPVMTFDADFGLVPLVVKPRVQNQVRQVILHALYDNGETLHAEYPASPTHVFGKVEEISRVRCNDQDTLDEWAERLYLYLNRDYTVEWIAPGLCGLLFELYDRVQITYTGTSANGVDIDWTGKKFWITDINVTPGEAFSGVTRFVLEAENV